MVQDEHVLQPEVEFLTPNLVVATVAQVLQVRALILQKVLNDDQIRAPIFTLTQVHLAEEPNTYSGRGSYFSSLPSFCMDLSASMIAFSYTIVWN